MRPTFLTTAVLAAFASISTIANAQKITPPTTVPTEPKVDREELKKVMSYGLGFQKGEEFASFGFNSQDFDKATFIKAFLAALNQEDMDVDPAKYDQAMKMIDSIISNRELELAKKNQKAELAFMAKNAERKEVKTTASGLQYEILKKGTGKTYTPPAGSINGNDRATEFYIECTGTTLSGTEFIKTPKGEPIAFNLQVIHGFAEALKMMPIGSKWKIYVPAKLAFGLQRQGSKIEPNSMLTYEIELHDIKLRKPDPARGGQHPQHPIMPSRP